MSEVTREQVDALLITVQEKYLERDLLASNMVKDVDIKGDTVFVRIVQGYPSGEYREELAAEVKVVLEADANISKAEITVEQNVTAHVV